MNSFFFQVAVVEITILMGCGARKFGSCSLMWPGSQKGRSLAPGWYPKIAVIAGWMLIPQVTY
jgi:hypothetical protein